MTNQTGMTLNGGLAIAFVTAFLGVLVWIDSRSARTADDVAAMSDRIVDNIAAIQVDSREMRDLVMQFDGKLIGFAASLMGGEADRLQIHDRLRGHDEKHRTHDAELRDIREIIRELERGR